MAQFEGEFAGYKPLAIGKLVEAPWNYKRSDPEKAQKLIENIKRNGQIVNLNVRTLPKGKHEVIDGNHRLIALRKIEAKRAMCYDHGKISEAAAQRISAEINFSIFDDDPAKKAKLFEALSEQWSPEELAETLFFDPGEITEQIGLASFDWGTYEAGAKGESEEDPEYTKIELFLLPEIFEAWQKWCERCSEILGYDQDEKCLEFAIIEALNIPEESLST